MSLWEFNLFLRELLEFLLNLFNFLVVHFDFLFVKKTKVARKVCFILIFQEWYHSVLYLYYLCCCFYTIADYSESETCSSTDDDSSLNPITFPPSRYFYSSKSTTIKSFREREFHTVRTIPSQRKCSMNVEDYCEYVGFSLEEHEIFTLDGFSLPLHRISPKNATSTSSNEFLFFNTHTCICWSFDFLLGRGASLFF